MLALLLCFVWCLTKGQAAYKSGATIEVNDTIMVSSNGYQGQSDSPDRYSVNFMIQSDNAFHFNPRFNEGQVVRNTNIGGHWGREERIGGMQLSSDRHERIILEFKFTETKWEVSYMHNRIPDYDYNHRMTGDITDVIVNGLDNATIEIIHTHLISEYNYLSRYLCKDLSDYTHLTHDISQNRCIQQCEKMQGDSCAMINYFTYYKSTNDARCYIFDKLCQISVDTLDTNHTFVNRSVIAYKDHTGNCTDHPSDWTDNVGDSCIYYTAYDWCSDGNVLKAEKQFYDLVDAASGVSAIESCCGCGGGIYTMDSVVLSYDTNWMDWNDILCAFTPSNDSNSSAIYRRWDNLILYQLCVHLVGKDACSFLVDTEFQSSEAYSIFICDRHEITDNMDSFEFIMEVIQHQNWEIYINSMWFDIDHLYYSNAIDIHFVTYDECESNVLQSNTSQYMMDGIHPCYILKDAGPPAKSKRIASWIVPALITLVSCIVICGVATWFVSKYSKKTMDQSKPQKGNPIEMEGIAHTSCNQKAGDDETEAPPPAYNTTGTGLNIK